jgi:hypothetical protein
MRWKACRSRLDAVAATAIGGQRAGRRGPLETFERK